MSQCIQALCIKEAAQSQLCKAHYAKMYRKRKKDLAENIDYNDFWEFVKKELKIG